MKYLSLLLVCASAFAQSFPSSIFTPLVAKDNLQTTLSSAQGAGDSVAVVASSTGWVANMVLYICDTTTGTRCTGTYEAELVTNVAGNILTVTRAYGGTSAYAHASGKAVLNAPTAIYNTNLNNEVLAIETALGANMANVASAGYLNSNSYIFSAQTCNSSGVCIAGGANGKSLIAGTNSLTLTPVPLGVNGTNTATPHLLRVSGGVGTAENCSITGGSGLSGQTSGQIIISCANTHSGAWTIASATDGIQEATWAAGPTGSVYMPAGAHTFPGTITIPSTYTKFSLRGAGPYSTTLIPQSTSTDVIYWPTAGTVSLYNFGIQGQHGGSAGWAIKVTNATWGEISGLYIDHGYNGMYLSNPNSIHVSHVVGYGLDKIGLQIDATSGQVAVSKFESLDFSTYGHLVSTNTDISALYLTTQSGGTFAGPTFTDCQFLGYANAVYAVAAASTSLNEVTFLGGGITGHVYGVRVVATGASAYNWRLDGVQYIAALSSDPILSGPAISIDDGVSRFSVTNSTIETAAPTFQAIDVMGSKFVTISSNSIWNASGGAAIEIGPGHTINASNIWIKNNEIGYAGQAGTPAGTYAVEVTAAAHSNITIQNNRLYGSTAALNFLATGLGNLIAGNSIDTTSGATGKPTCAAAIKGSLWYTPSANGTIDKYEICRKDAADALAWTALY